jgi:polysaccharide export outer membrane protein
MLSGCSIAPGMRMETSAAIPTGEQSDAMQVPVDVIDASVVRRLRDDASKRHASTATELYTASKAYTLGAGDVLQIVVWDHPELAVATGAQSTAQARPADAPTGFVVDQSGNVQFPYAGDVKAAGSDVAQFREQLVKQLSHVYRNPQVTVRIVSFRAKQMYLDGEVRSPGAQPINDKPMTLFEAISRAGGFSPQADQSRMVLVRDGVSYPLNLAEMLEYKQDPSRIMLRDGDFLRVQSRDDSGVFVMGEINKPATALPMKNGKLSLSDALSQAGSLNPASSDAAKVYVVRGAEEDAPHVYRLDASSPVSMLLANQFQLQPKDIVYVDSTGLARLSRILVQLLPAINAGLTGIVVTK